MSRTLSIPVHQTITLPDNWQACRTPQELSYWLISQFDEFEHEVETLAASFATLQGDVDNLEDTVSNIDTRLVVVEGQINNPTDGILATLAALATADAAINAHLDDTDHNVSANAASIYQLNVDITAINADLVNIHDVLITYGSDIAALQTDTAALKTTVGDSTSGLVKKTNDLDAEINSPNGLDDRVTALEQGGGGGGTLYRHRVNFSITGGTAFIEIITKKSTALSLAEVKTYFTNHSEYNVVAIGSEQFVVATLYLYNNTLNYDAVRISLTSGSTTASFTHISGTVSSISDTDIKEII